MKFFDFLSSFSAVETVIGLLAFIIASVLAYLGYSSSLKYKKVSQIITAADTEEKSKLASSILEVFPSYKIPDLTKQQGFEIVKLQLEQTAARFQARIRLLRLGMIIFSLLVLVLVVKNALKVENISTSGNNSPAIKGDSVNIRYENNTHDSIK